MWMGEGRSVVVHKKKKSRIKLLILKFKRFLRRCRTPVFICAGLLIFPIVVGLFYKIPISFVDIPVGDLLSFYAVGFGLFASYITYKTSEDQKNLAKQTSLRPRIELGVELNDSGCKMNVCIKNATDNDYLINYISSDYCETYERRYLNAKERLAFAIDSEHNVFPQSIYVGLKDNDGNEWGVGFEYQEDSRKYCRTFIDPVA